VASADVRQNQRPSGNRKATYFGGAWSNHPTGRKLPERDAEKRTQIIEESYDYYRTPRAQHPNSRSVFVFTDFARLMDFNYYSQIERVAPRPLLFIVGTEAATLFMSKAGYEKAKEPKEWFEIPGATHHQLYDDEAAVGKAVAKLEEFFGRSL
jgi:uncharacterized protein